MFCHLVCCPIKTNGFSLGLTLKFGKKDRIYGKKTKPKAENGYSQEGDIVIEGFS